MSRQERLAAAHEEFKNVIKSEPEKSGARFVNVKSKSSQVGLTVTNSVTVKDQAEGTKYVISVSACVSGKDASPEMLEDVQAAIAKFLQNVHESI